MSPASDTARRVRILAELGRCGPLDATLGGLSRGLDEDELERVPVIMRQLVEEGRVQVHELNGSRRYELALVGARSCRVCGCTDLDCSGCVQRTGMPCWWIEPDLCSACERERSARS